MTVPDKTAAGSFVMRDLVLRFYWDDEETPSVECPVGDFFCNGFGERAIVNSMPICVNPTGGMNCYFEMPFRKHAKVTLTSEHPGFIKYIFYTFNYALTDVPDDAMYFHARFNRERSTRRGVDYTVLDGVRGKGYYVGTYMALCALERYWWGEGEMKFFLDGDEEFPTVTSTGARTTSAVPGPSSTGRPTRCPRRSASTRCSPATRTARRATPRATASARASRTRIRCSRLTTTRCPGTASTGGTFPTRSRSRRTCA